MPRNGSGTYNLPAGNPVATQTLITSNWANTTMTDLATALTNSLSKDGQTVPTANLPMGGFRHTGVGVPTARDQYNLLSWAQDGTDRRLTGVAGTDSITANMPGAAITAYVTGMQVQLTPAAQNTGAATLNINGLGAKSIKTPEGSELASGNLKVGSMYNLQYDGTKFILMSGLGAWAESAISGWQRPASGTYPLLTIGGPSTVNIPAGSGRIIPPGSPDATGVIEVSWADQSLILTGMATSWSTQIGVNSAGTVVQLPGPLNPASSRSLIMLGTAVHISGSVNSVSTIPAIYGDMTYASYDIASLFQNNVVSGCSLTANGISAFHFDIEAGTLFSLGAAPNTASSPNLVPFPDTPDVQFFPITGTNGVGGPTSNVPTTNYDPGGLGVITTLPNPTSTTIHRVYYLSGVILLLYGQNLYTDLATALSSLAIDDSSTVLPSKLQGATQLGYIIAQKNCANLNNTATARLLTQSSAGGGSGGSGGSIPDAPSDGTTYGRKDATWVNVVPEPRGAAGTNRFIFYYTNALARFAEGINNTAESGSNAGSDWELRAYNDAGTLIGTAFKMIRATMKGTFYANLTVETTASPTLWVNATGNAVDNRKVSFTVDANGNALIQTNNDNETVKNLLRLNDAGGVDHVSGATYYWSLGTSRFQADFSAATVSNRFMFQTSGVNQFTAFSIIPNGSSTTALYSVFNNSAPDNSGTLQLRMDASLAIINSTKTGSGTTRDLALQFDNTDFWRYTTAFRMQADFSNATIGNRWAFQTSTVNGATVINALPNGTGTTSSYRLFNSSDANNSGFVGLTMTNTVAQIESSKAGTGATRDLSFTFDGAQKALLATTGQLTIESFLTTKGAQAAVQFYGRTSGAAEWIIYADGGLLKFFGTADRMTLDNSGNLNVNGTVNSGISSGLMIVGSTGGSNTRFKFDGTFSTDGGSTFLEIGYRDTPRVTGGLDRGKMFATSAGLTVNTGPAAGSTYSVYNDSASNITLTQGGGLTMRKAGTATTGNLTLAARGFATIWFNSTTECIVSGNV